MSELFLGRITWQSVLVIGLVFMLLAVELPMSFGSVGISESQVLEKGISSLTIPSGGYSGSQAVTFPVPFRTAPNVTLNQVSTIVNPLNQGDQISIVAPGTSVTWAGMPTLQTELFGTTNNRARLNDQSPLNMWFSVDVVTAGTGTATLRVQTSPDQTNWVDPCATPGTADLSISATGLIVTACQINPMLNSFMRIIGFNGNGVVSPVFGLITVNFLTTVQTILTLVPLSVTPTGFLIFGNMNIRSGGQSVTIQWIALECLSPASEAVGSC